jgi:uncharacterized protein YunC (DUF1805 family)
MIIARTATVVEFDDAGPMFRDVEESYFEIHMEGYRKVSIPLASFLLIAAKAKGWKQFHDMIEEEIPERTMAANA